jgi:hypothetical protein
VAGNIDGSSEEGVKYWKCWLGNRKILKVTRAMNYSINGMCSLLSSRKPCVSYTSFVGLKNHLQRTFPAHYRLYEVLKKENRSPTAEETLIIQGCKVLDEVSAQSYLKKLDNISNNIRDMLEKQAALKKVCRLI